MKVYIVNRQINNGNRRLVVFAKKSLAIEYITFTGWKRCLDSYGKYFLEDSHAPSGKFDATIEEHEVYGTS